MLDAKILRDRPSEVLSIYRERLFDDAAAELAQSAISLDDKRRNLLQAADELKAKRNGASQLIGREKDADKRAALNKDMESVKIEIAGLDAQLTETEGVLDKLLLQLPNLPDPEVPTGRSDAENSVVRTEGKLFEFAFAPKPHWEIGESLGIIDLERGVKISGSRFNVLKGTSAQLQRSLSNCMMHVHL